MMTSSGIYSGPPPNLHPQDKPLYGSIRDYWNDMSNGQVIFTGGVWNASGGSINWVALDYNKIDYHNSTRDLRTDVLNKVLNEPTPGPNLIRAIIYAGNEYDGGGLNPSSAGYEYIDSEEFGRPTSNPVGEWPGQFFKNIGVACHELGHAAFGFPDRYGTYNTLQWDLMGIGQKNGDNGEMACPVTVNPFDRQSESWISFQSFSGTQAAKPFTYNYSTPQIFQVAVSGNECFLNENRRNQFGGSGTFDKFLPEQGLLAWHVRNSTGAGTLNVIEADNVQDELTQAGDPFPGAVNNTNLNDFITPNCKYTTGANSQMIMHYVSAPSATMTADLGSKWFGALPLNLTWSGNVIVGGNMTIPAERTLTISPGTTITIEAGFTLDVQGTLVIPSNATISGGGTIITSGNGKIYVTSSADATAYNNSRKLVRDSAGNYHLTFESDGEICYEKWINSGTALSEFIRLSSGTGNNKFPCIAERSGKLYVFWQRKTGTNTYATHFRHHNGASWEALRTVNGSITSSNDLTPVLAVSTPAASFEMIVVYRTNSGLRFRRSTTSTGAPWEAAATVDRKSVV